MKKLLILIMTILLLASCQKKQKEYTPGELVSFGDENWYVLQDNGDHLTLLSEDIIYPDSIFFDDDVLFNQIIYWKQEKVSYPDSAIRLYLQEELLTKLPQGDLYKVDNQDPIRLLSLNDLSFIEFETTTDENGILHYSQKGDQDYSWIVGDNETFWLMDEAKDTAENIVYGESAAEQYIHSCLMFISNYNIIELTSVAEKMPYGLKTVINVNKSAFAD